jgi:hypothetical protein
MDVQMPSGLVIPSSLKYSLYRMIQDAAISTNVLRLIPLNLQTVNGGGLISVRLPLATCSLPSFSMSFNNTISSLPTYTGADATTFPNSTILNGTSFPQGLEGLIQRLEIVVAGVSLLTLPNYNMLYQVLKDINQTFDHRLSRHIVEGEDDVAAVCEGGNLDSSPCTVFQWDVVTTPGTSASLVVNCSTADCPSVQISGESLYMINAPPSTFFGWTASAAGSSLPTVTNIAPDNVYVDGYVVGQAWQFTLSYPVTTGVTWSRTGANGLGTVLQLSNYPFSAYITSYSTAVENKLKSGNTENNTIRDFLGFFKAMPKAIQLAALGEVEIRIYLEQPQNVLVTPSPPQTLDQITGHATPCYQVSSPQYQLTNIEFQIRTMSWDNGWLDSMMQAELAQGQTLEIPYPNYYSVVQGNQPGAQTTTRFSVNTQNLRQVWGINKPLIAAPSSAFSYVPQQLFIPSGFGVTSRGEIGNTYKGAFFATTASNPSLFVSPPLTSAFSDAGVTKTTAQSNRYQYLINNQLIPNLLVAPQRNYAFTQEILGKEDWEEGTAVGTPMKYMSFNYAMGISLEYIDKYCDASVRELFGLDTRSASSVFYLNQTNNNLGDTTLVFSLFTSVLRVAMNNQIQVII